MRLRRKPDTDTWLAEQGEFIQLEPQRNKGKWHQYFGNDNPIHIELGMGKGKFISELSAKYPDINFIGIDMYDELVRRAGEKAQELHRLEKGEQPRNLCLVRWNIEQIEDVFAEGEAERIYLNHSDPWPKKRHEHRRLTHPRFLQKYQVMLSATGEIHLKTDSALLFEYSLNTFSEMRFRLRHITLDLHREGTPSDHIFTEYESKFVSQGMPIYRCEAIVDGK